MVWSSKLSPVPFSLHSLNIKSYLNDWSVPLSKASYQFKKVPTYDHIEKEIRFLMDDMSDKKTYTDWIPIISDNKDTVTPSNTSSREEKQNRLVQLYDSISKLPNMYFHDDSNPDVKLPLKQCQRPSTYPMLLVLNLACLSAIILYAIRHKTYYKLVLFCLFFMLLMYSI
jgi:hypothetical protein